MNNDAYHLEHPNPAGPNSGRCRCRACHSRCCDAQYILRNPLASPFTLGLSNAAALGATVGILLFGTGTTGSSIADAVVVNNPYLTIISAFVFSILMTVIILLIVKMWSATPETMVVAGVNISSLFS